MTKERAGKPHNPLIYILVAVFLVAAGVGGIRAGNWLSRRNAIREEGRRVDEYQGLGERTGLTGEVTLQVNPISMTVESGDRFSVSLTLTNKTSRTLLLNNWLTPAPTQFQSNQLPVKMVIRKSGREVRFFGQPKLLPLHKKKDFTAFGPGKSRVFRVEMTAVGGTGRWDIAEPGVYSVEIWYETYLSGKYIGVKAWNGMTNHVVVQVTVRPRAVSVR